jgi:hypothetical protein
MFAISPIWLKVIFIPAWGDVTKEYNPRKTQEGNPLAEGQTHAGITVSDG